MVTAEQVKAAKALVTMAYDRAREIEGQFTVETVEPQLRKEIGKCFRYPNQDSAGHFWPLFIRIISVKDGEHQSVQTQYRKDYGVLTVEFSRFHASIREKCVEISKREYAMKVQSILDQAKRMVSGK